MIVSLNSFGFMLRYCAVTKTQTDNGKDGGLWGVFHTCSLDFGAKLASWKSKLKDLESTSEGCQFLEAISPLAHIPLSAYE